MENRDSKSRVIIKKYTGQKKAEEILSKIIQLFCLKSFDDLKRKGVRRYNG